MMCKRTEKRKNIVVKFEDYLLGSFCKKAG
nr:MAG TPA: hypothetical protein [Caudoviricetes sp.]